MRIAFLLGLVVATALSAQTVHQLPATPSTVAYGYYWSEAKPALTVKSGDIVEVETQLGRLDADMRGKASVANLIEEPEIMLAHRDCCFRVGDRFAKLSEKKSPTGGGDDFARLERVFGSLARHELPGGAFYERTAQREIVERPTSRRRQQNRASERHVRFPA